MLESRFLKKIPDLNPATSIKKGCRKSLATVSDLLIIDNRSIYQSCFMAVCKFFLDELELKPKSCNIHDSFNNFKSKF